MVTREFDLDELLGHLKRAAKVEDGEIGRAADQSYQILLAIRRERIPPSRYEPVAARLAEELSVLFETEVDVTLTDDEFEIVSPEDQDLEGEGIEAEEVEPA